MPPTTPGSVVIVRRSMIFSSAATLATPSGIPMPRFTTLFGRSSSAARRAMTLRSDIGMGVIIDAGIAELAGERRAVRLGERLHVVFGLFRHDDAVDEDAGDLHLPRVQRPALGDALHLGDDDPARIVHRHRDREAFERERLVLHRDVAVGVGGRAANEADVDRERLVEQVFLAADRHQRDEVFLRARVDLAAAVARVDERADADPRQRPGLAGGDVAEEVRDHALRQVVRLDLVADGERLQLGHEAPVPADDALDETGVPQVIEAAFRAIPLAGGIDERQVARVADAGRRLLRRLDEALLERDRDVLGKPDAHEAGRGDRVAVANQCDRLAGSDDLAVLERAQRVEQALGVLSHVSRLQSGRGAAASAPS